VAFAAVFFLLLVSKVLREMDIRRNPYQVVEVQQEAKDIWSLSFQGRPLDYQPGQFMYLRLLRKGKTSSSHPFTISSSPTWERLAVTPKSLGDFTATVKDTKPGDKAYVDAPYGAFSFLNYKCKNIMFIAGGIGITPFISMISYMYDENIKIPVTLLWANKSEEELCYRDELARMEEGMENLKVVYVMSQQKDWKGEKGRINRNIIEKYKAGIGDFDYFVCGPPPMSKAVMAALKDMGVPKDKIRHELFEF
jgi:predicted ferric reductase